MTNHTKRIENEAISSAPQDELYIELLKCATVMAYLGTIDAEDIYSDTFEIVGEDEQGREGCMDASIVEWAARTATLLAKLCAQPASCTCWSCGRRVTLERRAAADGFCPNCGAEIDLEDYPPAVVVPDNEPSQEWFNCLIEDILAIDCMYRGSPTYDHDAYWMRERVVKMLEKRRDNALKKGV